jgi:hypothetical protein
LSVTNSSIKKALASLDGIAEHLTRYRTASMRYESKLALHARKEELMETVTKEFVLAAAIEAWQSAVIDNNFHKISRRHIRVLCCVSEIATTPAFTELLRNRNDEINVRMVRDLIGVYFALWTERNKFKHFQSTLSSILSSYVGQSPLMNRWQEHSNQLIGDKAPSLLAETLGKRNTLLKDFFAELQLPREHAEFSNAVMIHLAEFLTDQLDTKTSLDRAKWDHFKQIVLKEASFKREQINHILSRLIIVIDDHLGSSGWDSIKTYVRDYVLKHPGLGDPRIEAVKWEQFDPTAKRVFTSWLAEEDIGMFFELIIKNDPHRRKPYWLRFAKQAHNSMLIVGESDYKLHQNALQKFAAEGRTFGKGYGLPTSAFVLDFGRVAIVEFSEVNNACFLYKRSDLPGLFRTTAAGWKDLKVLKDKQKSIHVQSHHRGWEAALDTVLLKFGVEPVD